MKKLLFILMILCFALPSYSRDIEFKAAQGVTEEQLTKFKAEFGLYDALKMPFTQIIVAKSGTAISIEIIKSYHTMPSWYDADVKITVPYDVNYAKTVTRRDSFEETENLMDGKFNFDQYLGNLGMTQ
ncbi:MAG: hypothetical protein LBV04_08675 [Deferribacteraceae bacterium]|jgi:hypothetical protein|nr:hypothetical protein [Deferribacteraceae bacterium]